MKGEEDEDEDHNEERKDPELCDSESERKDEQPVLWVAVKRKKVKLGDLELDIKAGSPMSSWFYNTLAEMFHESLRRGLENGLIEALNSNSEQVLDELNTFTQQVLVGRGCSRVSYVWG